MVINTGTTIITFLMVFLIQKTQNKDGKSIQLKLNELIAAIKGASNGRISIENLNEEELDKLHKFYKKLIELETKQSDFGASHSIDAAKDNHESKHGDKATPSKILKRNKPDNSDILFIFFSKKDKANSGTVVTYGIKDFAFLKIKIC